MAGANPVPGREVQQEYKPAMTCQDYKFPSRPGRFQVTNEARASKRLPRTKMHRPLQRGNLNCPRKGMTDMREASDHGEWRVAFKHN